jgi:predicted ABC-type ATPase
MTIPHIVILAGPNGAGKSTTAPILLRDTLAVEEFVNADAIAQGLSAFAPERVALPAGRIMLNRLRELAKLRANFAFETTLASRSFAGWLKSLQPIGYRTHLVFLSLPSVQFAIHRVAARVKLGGHDIPSAIIIRRFHAGLINLFQLYMPIVSSWGIYDNSRPGYPIPIASGEKNGKIEKSNGAEFERLLKEYGHGQ